MSVSDALARRRLPWWLAALAAALLVPALNLGFQLDDHYLRLALSDPPLDPVWARGPADLFAFFTGDSRLNRHARDTGAVPWWASDGLRLAFFRPLSGLTHWLDFRLWPERPGLMHAHSLAWLGACVAAAAAFYRRLPLPPAVAGLAGLLFAVDDTHGVPAAWLANRNALVAGFFGVLCLAAHDRWRRDGWRPGRALAPILLLLGLLGGEMALATGGYLLAYALFLEPGAWRSRLLSLVPATAVGISWALAYRGFGYGSRDSLLYVDPARSPLEFLGVCAERLPILLFGQWALPADLHGLLSERAARLLWLVAIATVAVVALLLAPLLRHDRVSRFFATGMLLSLLPAAATFPSGRLLFFTGLGGAGLLAQWLAGIRGRASWLPLGAPGLCARALFWPAVVLHLVFAPLGLIAAADGVRMLGDVAERSARSIPSDAAGVSRRLFVVTTPTAFLTAQAALIRGLSAGRPSARVLVLGSGVGPTTVRRPHESALLVRPRDGYLARPGSVAIPGASEPTAFDQNHMFALFDRLYRGDTAFVPNQRLAIEGVDIEIATVTADGRPHEVLFRFERPLEDPGYGWLQWRHDVYVSFAVPGVGESVELPGAVVGFEARQP